MRNADSRLHYRRLSIGAQSPRGRALCTLILRPRLLFGCLLLWWGHV